MKEPLSTVDPISERKWKTRFESLQTMVEARHALKSLFDQAAEYNRKEVLTKRELSELAYSHKEVTAPVRMIRSAT